MTVRNRCNIAYIVSDKYFFDGGTYHGAACKSGNFIRSEYTVKA